MTRSKSREILMQLLFLMEVQRDFRNEVKERFFSEQEIKSDRFTDNLYETCIANLTEIDKLLDNIAENWSLNRINRVDLAILRLATAELLYMKEAPAAVVVNEAVNLAKKYGTDDSGRFVNGVLGKIIRNLKNENNGQ